jgi:hypothetical protein
LTWHGVCLAWPVAEENLIEDGLEYGGRFKKGSITIVLGKGKSSTQGNKEYSGCLVERQEVEKLAICSRGGGGVEEVLVLKERWRRKLLHVFIPPPTLVHSCWGMSTAVAAIQANFPPPLKYLGGGCVLYGFNQRGQGILFSVVFTSSAPATTAVFGALLSSLYS